MKIKNFNHFGLKFFVFFWCVFDMFMMWMSKMVCHNTSTASHLMLLV